MQKVAIFLSGGMDSAIAASFLKKRYEVFALTAIMSPCGKDELVEKSKNVANALGIKHYIVDISKIFSKEIIEYFAKSYINGETPTPCVLCNKKIKFGVMFKKALELGADYIATGHYAKIVKSLDGVFHLYKADDEKKDQSYFLSLLNQSILSKTLFPLSSISKEDVREIIQNENLPINTSVESQDLCFASKGEHYKIIEQFYKKDDYKGNIIDTSGNILKKHQGYYLYTVGQRKGLGVSAKTPLYVKSINPNTCDVIVSKKEDVFSSNIKVKNINWITKPLEIGESFICKIRYNHKGEKAFIKKLDNENFGEIEFLSSVFSATKGQLASFYKEDGEVLGGGIIVAE
ncbi:MAG: tRNA 2-thiouridine(34) synthase MnmA [Bdellovibrionota bacterium]